MLRRIKNLIIHRQPAVNNLTTGPWLKRKKPAPSGATAPVNTVSPAVTGTAAVGQVLTCSQGTWTGTPTPTYAYQWLQGGSNISGATSSTYTVISGDAGTTLSCRVTATNSAGSASATSNGVAIPASFSPASLFASGEQGAWYDPSDFSTMFQDSAGTTPVTAVGQPVGKINDKSGRNNHATQVTAAARPVLRQDANSKYYLEFDGVDDWLSTAEIDFSSTDKASAFLGFLQPAGSTGVMYELSANTNSNNAFSMLTASPSFIQHNPSGYSVANVSVALGTKCVFSCTYNRALSIDENAVRLNSEIPTITRPNNVDLSGNFGSYPIYIGSRGGSSLRFTGYSYSLIILGRLATGQEIADTEAWVNERTGAF